MDTQQEHEHAHNVLTDLPSSLGILWKRMNSRTHAWRSCCSSVPWYTRSMIELTLPRITAINSAAAHKALDRVHMFNALAADIATI